MSIASSFAHRVTEAIASRTLAEERLKTVITSRPEFHLAIDGCYGDRAPTRKFTVSDDGTLALHHPNCAIASCTPEEAVRFAIWILNTFTAADGVPFERIDQ
jgi:hypothetical protein